MPRSPFAILLLVTVFASGCAGGGALQPEATLDERTGTTVSQLSAPLQLLATEPGSPNNDPFVFAAPFETNRMGERRLYLWLAVPAETDDPPAPTLQVDDQPFTPPAVQADPAALGVAALPYAPPAPWSRIYVFALDEAALRRLEAAGHLSVTMQYTRAGEKHFSGDWDGRGAVAHFRRSLGLAD